MSMKWTFGQSKDCDLFIVAAQSLSRVQLLAVPWTVALQASLSFTISWNLLKLMSIELMVPSNHLMLCTLNLSQYQVWFCFFPMSWLFTGVSGSASVLPMNIQDWFPLELTGLISLLSKDSQDSSPAPQFESLSSYRIPYMQLSRDTLRLL